jgi:hypothetical protein
VNARRDHQETQELFRESENPSPLEKIPQPGSKSKWACSRADEPLRISTLSTLHGSQEPFVPCSAFCFAVWHTRSFSPREELPSSRFEGKESSLLDTLFPINRPF